MRVLQSQRQQIKDAIEAGLHVVYGYLRAKDSGTAKAGTPYYIGIASWATRPYRRHSRGGRRNAWRDVPVPKDEGLIRCFGTFKSRAGAIKREQHLIAKYGRKKFDHGGILLNITLGGEGALGLKLGIASRAKLSAGNAERYGLSDKEWLELSPQVRAKMRLYILQHPGFSAKDYLAGIRAPRGGSKMAPESVEQSRINSLRNTAEKLGIPLCDWAALTQAQRGNVYKWLRVNLDKTAADYVLHCGSGGETGATLKKYGVSKEFWASLSQKQKDTAADRYKRGHRGESLFVERLPAPKRTPSETEVNNLKQANVGKSKRNGIAMGFDPDWFVSLPAETRRLISKRYRRGKRGDELVKGLI